MASSASAATGIEHPANPSRRDFLYVRDHCVALDRIINFDRDRIVGEVFNLGTQQDLSILEIANAVKAAMPEANSEI